MFWICLEKETAGLINSPCFDRYKDNIQDYVRQTFRLQFELYTTGDTAQFKTKGYIYNGPGSQTTDDIKDFSAMAVAGSLRSEFIEEESFVDEERENAVVFEITLQQATMMLSTQIDVLTKQLEVCDRRTNRRGVFCGVFCNALPSHTCALGSTTQLSGTIGGLISVLTALFIVLMHNVEDAQDPNSKLRQSMNKGLVRVHSARESMRRSLSSRPTSPAERSAGEKDGDEEKTGAAFFDAPTPTQPTRNEDETLYI